MGFLVIPNTTNLPYRHKPLIGTQREHTGSQFQGELHDNQFMCQRKKKDGRWKEFEMPAHNEGISVLSFIPHEQPL